MEYIHIKNLDKFHPGYKDRTLQWAKIYFKMVQGDPDCEMIEDEIDWARLLKFILLELEAQKPIPLDEKYLTKKGFNLKKRPISKTLQMLYNFIEVLQNSEDTVHRVRVREEKDKEKSIDVTSFENLYLKYPKKVGKKDALRHFKASVKTDEDLKNINKALYNYIASDRVAKGFIQNASTWFRNWQDWIDFTETTCKQCKGTGKYENKRGY